MIEESAGPAGVEVRIEGFEDFEVIGQGGFGVVYKARQPHLNRLVAIKVLVVAGLDEHSRRRFEREQQAMGSLSAHPAIVTLYDSGFTATGLPYLAMELMERGSAADRLRAEGKLEVAEAAAVMARIADAVAAAHEVGLLHRDIKPENILFSSYGEAKLTDFGVAAMLEGTATATTAVTATVEHAAPEVLAGVRPTQEADIYSLGSTLFALVSGRSPFRRSSDESVLPVLARAATEPVPDLRETGVPDAVCEIIEGALAKDPTERLDSAARLGELLREVSGTAPSATTILPVTAPPPAPVDTVEEAPSGAAPENLTRVVSAPAQAPPAAAPSQERTRSLRLVQVDKNVIGRLVADTAAMPGSELRIAVARRLGRRGAKAIAGAVSDALTGGALDRVVIEQAKKGDLRRIRKRLQSSVEVSVIGDKLAVTPRGARRPAAAVAPPSAPPAPEVAPPMVEDAPAAPTTRCEACGTEKPSDAVACPGCGAVGDAPRSRLVPLLGIGAIAIGALLPWSAGFGPRWINVFSDPVSYALVDDDGFGVVLGSAMIGLAAIAGLLVLLRTRAMWPIALAVLATVPALWYMGDWIGENAEHLRFDHVLRTIGPGPWLAVFGLALVAIGPRRPKTLLVASAVAVVGGAFYLGFEYPIAILWDGYSDREWYVSVSLFALVLFLPGLILALNRRAPWVALSLMGAAVALATATIVEATLDYMPFAGFADALAASIAPVLVVAAGAVAMVVVAQQAKRGPSRITASG